MRVRRGLKEAHFAGAAHVALAAHVLFSLPMPLARHRSGSPFTIVYFVPLAALMATPFFLCRPVFEGMGRGRAGLTISVFRYLVLAAAAISSVVFPIWTRKALIGAAKGAQNPFAAA